MVAIFEHERGKQYETNVKKVNLVAVAVVDAGKAVLMDESYLLRR
jgi:hypothetical protein